MTNFTIGDRVLIVGKNVIGKIAYVGHTHFSDGLCFGVILDEPKGRNNGSFEGVRYFKCTRNHGIFVRDCQLQAISRTKSKEVKSEEGIKNTKRYPNYLKVKKSLKLHKGMRKQKIPSLTARKVCSDTQLVLSQTNFDQEVEQNVKPETIFNRKSHPRNAEFPNKAKKKVLLNKNPSTFNSNTYQFQESNSETLDNNKVVTGAVKMKHAFKKLDTELKLAKVVIENNITDKENLEEQIDYYQKHAYALQKKINKLNKDLTDSDRKTKTLEQKMEQLNEITEMSIIEKEMSEHKNEQLEVDLQELMTKCRILQTELSIKEEEMQIQFENKVPTIYYQKQLECQNRELYNALLQLRNMYISKRKNFLEVEETVKNHLLALKNARITEENLQNVIFVMNQDIADMHETIDGLAEADELIFEVTDNSLTLEHKVAILGETLNITEEYIEVSDEIEEILQKCYMEREKDMEAMEHKLFATEKSFMNTINLVNDYKEELEKYKNLVFDFRMKNNELEFKLETVTQERKLAVMETENLKLQLNRENKMTLQHLIKDDNLEIENQIVLQQVKYLEIYLPENFFGRNEHLALKGKLMLSKMIQKLNLIQKHIMLKDAKYPFSLTQNHLQLMAFQTHFLLKIFVFQELLKTYDVSLDHADIGNFLSSGAYCEILRIKLKEIDHFLDLFCRNDLDTPYNMRYLNNTINMFKAMFNLKFCPEKKRKMLKMESLLKKIFVCVKFLKEHLILLKTSLKYHENEELKETESVCSTLIKDISYLLNCITGSKGHHILCYNEECICNLKNVLFEMDKLLALVVKSYDKNLEDRIEDLSILLKELGKLGDISIEIQLMKDSVQEGENLEVYDPAISSTFVSWIRDKKIEKENLINELQRKAFFLEKKLSNTTQHQIKEKQLLKQTIGKSSQTDEVHKIIKSEDSTIFSLKLYDMECMLKFFNSKIHQLQTERIKNQLSCLKPLKVTPRRKRYHPDVHNIIVFQKSLNKISEDLRKIILPEVVDISSKRNIRKSFRLSALIQRDLIKRDVQKRLQNLETEIHDFKNENCFK